MFYCKWNESNICGLNHNFGISILFTEIDDEGSVKREVGIDESNNVVHMFPSASFSSGVYGIFDNEKVDISSLRSDISKDDFERLWESRSLE